MDVQRASGCSYLVWDLGFQIVPKVTIQDDYLKVTIQGQYPRGLS